MIALSLALALAANPKPFPFAYTAETVAAGHLEIEQYVDMIPVRVVREAPEGTLSGIATMRFQLQTELELGITDALELGIYLVMSQGGEGEPFRFEGMKQRVRYRVFDPGELPVDLALYGEIAELFDELEIEEKLILSRRLGSVVLALNLWAEQELLLESGEWRLIFNPTLGASFELSPHLSLGVEGWMRARLEGETDVFAGPVLLAQLGEYWASVGGYLHIDGLAMEPGAPYGPVYLRVILGIGL